MKVGLFIRDLSASIVPHQDILHSLGPLFHPDCLGLEVYWKPQLLSPLSFFPTKHQAHVQIPRALHRICIYRSLLETTHPTIYNELQKPDRTNTATYALNPKP